MKTLKLIAALGLGSLVAACSGADIASRNAPYEAIPAAPATQPTQQAQPFQQAGLPASSASISVADVRVKVPHTLSVSEANSYYPRADIVWRGDPIGDRYQQVAAIFDTALRTGTQSMNGATPVTLDVSVVRFHSVSEKARYSVGGVHNMVFDLTVRRASTGEALAPTRRVTADLPALGGRAAIEADRQGQTQKVRVTGHLQQVIQQELSRYIAG